MARSPLPHHQSDGRQNLISLYSTHHDAASVQRFGPLNRIPQCDGRKTEYSDSSLMVPRSERSPGPALQPYVVEQT